MNALHPTFQHNLFSAMDSDGRWMDRIDRGFHLFPNSSWAYEALL